MIGRRRFFLDATGAALWLAVAPRSALAEELLRQGREPQNLATPIHLFDRLITPTPSFFVRSHFGPPALDRGRAVQIEGLVASKLSLTAEMLKKTFPAVTVTAVLQCAGNSRAFQVP